MNLLLDIGNTNTHLGLANDRRVGRQTSIPTAAWSTGQGERLLARFAGRHALEGAALCSVVPAATPKVTRLLERRWHLRPFVLTHETVRGVGVDYPQPATIGADRLANAAAARFRFGAPAVVVDFGTAVTFDVVDRKGNYVGGIIAPGLTAMTDYLHEKTALLPKIRIREVDGAFGRNTRQAMLIGAVHGYRGLIHELLVRLKRELGARRLPVVATGGYARLMAAKLPDITAVDPLLTLEGLRLVYQAQGVTGVGGA